MSVSLIDSYEDLGSSMRKVTVEDSYMPLRYYPGEKIPRRGWINPVPSINFDGIWKKYLKSFKNDEELEVLAFDDLNDEPEPFRSCHHSFIVDLWMYSKSVQPDNRVLTISEIYRRSLCEGPKFAKWLDGFKTFVLSIVTDRCYFNIDDFSDYEPYRTHVEVWASGLYTRWIRNNPYEAERSAQEYRQQAVYKFVEEHHRAPRLIEEYEVKNLETKIRKETRTDPRKTKNQFEIGWIYRPNSCFPWQPPTLDYHKVCDTAIEQDPQIMEHFRMTCRRYLNDDMFHLEDENIDVPYYLVQQDSTRKAAEGEQYRIPLVKPAKLRGYTKIVPIPRERKECRAACIEEAASLTRIRMIEKSVKTLLQQDKRAVSGTEPAILQMKMREKFETKGRFGERTKFRTEFQRGMRTDDADWLWSYCRDFVKEGLTKPRNIITIMLEELKRRFPSVEAFKYPDFFETWVINEDGDLYYPTRGHGLGMCNSLTTLMQIIIEEMISEMVGSKPTWSGYQNDDAALIMPIKLLREWTYLDEVICNGLSLLYKKKATFVSPTDIVLCEQYVKKNNLFINKKDSFSAQTLGLICKAVNPAHARELARSMNLNNVPDEWVTLVTAYWGWILYRNEQRNPISIGGWWRIVQNGVDYSLWDKRANEKLNVAQAAAYLAYKHTELTFMPWKRHEKFPTKLAQALPHQFVELYGEEEIDSADMFRPSINEGENTRAWNSYYYRIRKAYRHFASALDKHLTQVTWEEVYKDESDKRISEDILPPYGMRKLTRSVEITTTTDVEMAFPFARPSLVNAYKAWALDEISGLDYLIKNGQNHRIILQCASNRKDANANTSGRAIFLRPDKRDPLHLREWNRICIPDDDDSDMYWHDPYNVLYVADRLGSFYRNVIPAYIPEKKKKLLNERTKVYGKIPLSWWFLIGSVKPEDQIFLAGVKSSFDPSNIEAKEYLESFVNLLRRNPGLGCLIGTTGFNRSDEKLKRQVYLFFKKIEKYQKYSATLQEKRRLKILDDDSGNAPRIIDGRIMDFDHPARTKIEINLLLKRRKLNAEEEFKLLIAHDPLEGEDSSEGPEKSDTLMDVDIIDNPFTLLEEVTLQETNAIKWDDCPFDDNLAL